MRVRRQRDRNVAAHHQAKQKPFNWLATLDGWVREWPRAECWTQPYDCFCLTRYPALRPLNDAAGKRAYDRSLDRQESKIAAIPKAKRALNKLSPEQRRQLVSLICDLEAEVDVHTKSRIFRKDFRELLPPHAIRLQRSLDTFKKRIRKALDTFSNITSGIPTPLGRDEILLELLTRVKQLEAVELPITAKKLRSALEHDTYYRLFEKDPVTAAMVQLFWFFRHGCGLPVGESEVRVALIRNGLWPVDAVRFDSGRTEAARGCDAVRNAVKLFRPTKRTTAPNC